MNKNICTGCGKEFNFILPVGICSNCLDYERHHKKIARLISNEKKNIGFEVGQEKPDLVDV